MELISSKGLSNTGPLRNISENEINIKKSSMKSSKPFQGEFVNAFEGVLAGKYLIEN